MQIDKVIEIENDSNVEDTLELWYLSDSTKQRPYRLNPAKQKHLETEIARVPTPARLHRAKSK